MTEHRDRAQESVGGPGSPPDWVDDVRAGYNSPPATPREEMWTAIQRGLEEGERLDDGASRSRGHSGLGGERGDGHVVDLAAHRRRVAGRTLRRGTLSMRWAWATAAAALLAVGIGIGRWSAPAPESGGESLAAEMTEDGGGEGLDLAAQLHFGRTESLITTVRSDARSGRVDASVGPWVRGLLMQTRLLMDARGEARDETQRLLSDLELVLVQILGASEAGSLDDARAREELDLAVRSLEQGEFLTRIRSAALPTMAGA